MAQHLRRSYAWSLLVLFLIIGWIYPAIGIIALVCMTAPVIVALVTGKRKWCAMFCPRGIFNDVILGKISRRQKTPEILSSTYFKIGFLIFLMANLIVGIMNANGSLTAIGLVFVRLVSLTTAVAIILGFVYSHRTWCGFCPMGFLATVAIKGKRLYRTSREIPGFFGDTTNKGVVLYTGEMCPACDRVKEQLAGLKVAFQEINIDLDKTARENMVAGCGRISIPSLVVEGKLIKNMDDKNLRILAEQKNLPLAG